MTHFSPTRGSSDLRGEGTPEKVAAAAAYGLTRLITFAKDYNIAIIVENHGGYSSNGQWLAGVMNSVGDDHCGTLPDFGNFCITRTETTCAEEYDMYKGVTEIDRKSTRLNSSH